MPGQKQTITVRGTDIDIEHVDALAPGGARFDLSTERKQWRVDITRSGSVEIVTTWRDGQLADLDQPEWMGDVVARLAR